MHPPARPAQRARPRRPGDGRPRYPVRESDPFHYCACGVLVERPARRCDACADRALALRAELGLEVARWSSAPPSARSPSSASTSAPRSPRGLAVVHAIRLAEAVRELDAADREYVAPLVANILVDLCTDAPTA